MSKKSASFFLENLVFLGHLFSFWYDHHDDQYFRFFIAKKKKINEK